MEALKETGAKTYSPGRVRDALTAYEALWDPLMPDCDLRFGDHSATRENTAANVLSFYDSRYDVIVPIVENWPERPN